MAEQSDPGATEQQPSITISHRRILIGMAVILGVGIAVALVAISMRFALGIFIGGILAYLNYIWLARSLASLFERASTGTKPVLLAVRYILRYVLIGVALLVIYLTGAVSVAGVILGLASFALAVVVAGSSDIISGFFKKGL